MHRIGTIALLSLATACTARSSEDSDAGLVAAPAADARAVRLQLRDSFAPALPARASALGASPFAPPTATPAFGPIVAPPRTDLLAPTPPVAAAPFAFVVPSPIAPALNHPGRFVMLRRDSATFFTQTGFAFALADARRRASTPAKGWGLRCTLVGAREGSLRPENEQRARVHRFVGATRATDVPTYARVVWEDVHPGVDLLAEPSRGGLAYRYILSPGAKVSDLVMRWEGAIAVRAIDEGRALEIETGIGMLAVRGLRAFAIHGDQRVELAVRHVVHGDSVGLEVDGWDGRVPLVIDPTIAWSSYLGGAGDDQGNALAVDASGSAWITGYTVSTDFPTTGGLDTTLSGSDAFVSKVSASGVLLWSSFLGGLQNEAGQSVVVDPSGNAFVAGYTSSTDFPSSGGFQTGSGGGYDAFVSKVSASGVLLWSSFLGGSGAEEAMATAADGAGNVFVAGYTTSTNFPSSGGFDTSLGGTQDAFVTRVSSSGTLLWSSFLGGSAPEQLYGVVADPSGAALLSGSTESPDFPTTSGLDTVMDGTHDAYVTKVSPSGTVVWSTFLGGSAGDEGRGVALDSAGNALVTGTTSSADFPTPGGFDTTLGHVADAFVAKLNAAGVLVWASYLGGGSLDEGRAIAVDGVGNVIVTGLTESTDFPVSGAFQKTKGALADAYVAKVSGSGALLWSSYLGGSSVDGGFGVGVNGSGDAFVAGFTQSSDFPSAGGFDTTRGGLQDAFVTKLGFLADGSACTLTSECRSSICVDGVCCDKPCLGKCEACTAGKKGGGADGVCAAIADGSDPDNDCNAQSCASGVVTRAQVCNGAGACRGDGTVSCGLYACASSACGTSCSSDSGCVGSAFCSGTVCTTDLDAGAACTRSTQCKSGFCVDGVCCDGACSGDCEACTAAAKGSGVDGVCGNVAADTDPRNRCTADTTAGSCNADGMCDGAGACRAYAKLGTPCGATTCASGNVSGKTCNGAGTCETASTPCAPYACDTAACKTSCATDSDCAADAYCTSAATCAIKRAVGASCGEGRECAAGQCVDGVCCESACTSQCEACNEPGTAGKCVPVSGAPRGSRTACAGDPDVCGGACDGTSRAACKLAPSTKSCGSKCSSGSQTPSTCDGLGACVVGMSRACAPFACADDQVCATTCTADAQCADGFRCSGGSCVPPAVSKCGDDGVSVVTEGKAPESCAPARCKAGRCVESCSSSDDCVPGFLCNSVNSKCEAPAAAPSEDEGAGCGCRTVPRAHGGMIAALPLLLAVALRRRRRAG